MKVIKEKPTLWSFFKTHTSEVLVIVAFAITIIFTIVDIILACHDVSLSDTLIEWVFKFFGMELIALSGIKISKHVGEFFGNRNGSDDIEG